MSELQRKSNQASAAAVEEDGGGESVPPSSAEGGNTLDVRDQFLGDYAIDVLDTVDDDPTITNLVLKVGLGFGDFLFALICSASS